VSNHCFWSCILARTTFRLNIQLFESDERNALPYKLLKFYSPSQPLRALFVEPQGHP
jgi:hypothetical protein